MVISRDNLKKLEKKICSSNHFIYHESHVKLLRIEPEAAR
jgi:hypothetical protein